MTGESGAINVFVVAGTAVIRAGLEAVLQTDAGLIVTGGAAEIPAAPFVFSAGQLPFDVLLINVESRKEFAALSEFLGGEGGESDNQSPSVVVLLAPDLQSTENVLELLRGGARGLLPYDAGGDEIAAAIAAAANDLICAAPEILDAILSRNAGEDFSSNKENNSPDAELIESLTAREREVLEMLAEGASNKAIADRMNISEHTVKFHVASVFGKLAVNSRTEAVTQALRRGLILL